MLVKPLLCCVFPFLADLFNCTRVIFRTLILSFPVQSVTSWPFSPLPLAVWLVPISALRCVSLQGSARKTTTLLCLPIRCGFISCYSCTNFHKRTDLRMVCNAIRYIMADRITSVITSYSPPCIGTLAPRDIQLPKNNDHASRRSS